MAADLPDLHLSVSFVVDDGKAAGPMSLGEVARSIAAGERAADTYVWWEGEADWVPFNSDVRLVLLLSDDDSDVDAPEEEAQAVEEITTDQVMLEEVAVEELAAEEIAAKPANGEPAWIQDVPLAEVVLEEVTAEEPSPEVDEDVLEVATTTQPTEVFMAPVVIEVAEEPAPVVIEMAEEPAPVEIVVAEELVELVELDEEIIDVRTHAASTEALALDEIEVSENSVLASVGARLEALASATRHARSSTQLDRAGASPVDSPVHADHGDVDLRAYGDDEAVVESYVDASKVRSSTLETQFDSMVRDTVNYERLSEQSERIRELLARACAASISRQGYSVDRRSELQGHYYLGFECGVDTRRMRLEITPTASVGGVSSQNAHVVMSWGRMAFDIEEALEVVQNQLPVADRRPGTISADAELDSGSVSTRVELIWAIEDFVGDDYSINRDALELALASTQHALEKRWYELFIPAE